VTGPHSVNSFQVRVGIFEAHQSIIDGYQYRLGMTPGVQVVGTARNGQDLTTLLTQMPIDVLIMDVGMPMAIDNPQPFPILHVIPELTEKYPELSILIISMITDRVLINVLLDSGARGYILKEENAIIEQLGSVVLSVASGSNYVSDRVFDLLSRGKSPKGSTPLTPRQLQALSLAAAHPEWSGVELARELGVAHSTTRNLLAGAYVRLGVNNLSAALAKAEKMGLLTRRH